GGGGRRWGGSGSRRRSPGARGARGGRAARSTHRTRPCRRARSLGSSAACDRLVGVRAWPPRSSRARLLAVGLGAGEADFGGDLGEGGGDEGDVGAGVGARLRRAAGDGISADRSR